MRKWILKAILQKFFTLAPGGFRLNYLFQKHITKAVLLSDEFFETMLTHFEELQRYTAKNDFKIAGKHIFEIGTGWHVVVPVCFYLSGAEKIVTVDLNGHLRKENLKVLLEKVLRFQAEGKLGAFIPQLQKERLANIEALSKEVEHLEIPEILGRLHIRQHITDAADTQFEDGHFDLCYSVNVYEHIAEQALEGITREISRITRPGGMGYHAIGVYDHFVHVDPSLSKFNYLRFSRRQWRIIDNEIQPQNRLRISYFRALFEVQGFEVLNEIFQAAVPEDIERIKLHPDWQNEKELDIPYGTFILRKKA